jgi:hypothetical protein
VFPSFALRSFDPHTIKIWLWRLKNFKHPSFKQTIFLLWRFRFNYLRVSFRFVSFVSFQHFSISVSSLEEKRGKRMNELVLCENLEVWIRFKDSEFKPDYNVYKLMLFLNLIFLTKYFIYCRVETTQKYYFGFIKHIFRFFPDNFSIFHLFILDSFKREMIMRSNFMRSKFNFFRRLNFRSWGRNSICSWGQICPIILIRRLTLWSWDRNCLIMLFRIRSHDRICD